MIGANMVTSPMANSSRVINPDCYRDMAYWLWFSVQPHPGWSQSEQIDRAKRGERNNLFLALQNLTN